MFHRMGSVNQELRPRTLYLNMFGTSCEILMGCCSQTVFLLWPNAAGGEILWSPAPQPNDDDDYYKQPKLPSTSLASGNLLFYYSCTVLWLFDSSDILLLWVVMLWKASRKNPRACFTLLMKGGLFPLRKCVFLWPYLYEIWMQIISKLLPRESQMEYSIHWVTRDYVYDDMWSYRNNNCAVYIIFKLFVFFNLPQWFILFSLANANEFFEIRLFKGNIAQIEPT